MIFLSGFSLPTGGMIDNYASTLLRLIADKCSLDHKTLVDQSEHYKKFLSLCDFSLDDETDINSLPKGSKIITSEDIMDNILQLRVLNSDIGSKRDSIELEYREKKYEPNKLNSMEDFDEFKRRNRIKKMSKTRFIDESGGVRKREHSNGENVMMYFENEFESGKVYLLDEPEVSLSPKFQVALADKIRDMSRFFDCQFIIATHSPFILGIEDAVIYNIDEYPVETCRLEELESIRIYYDFFKKMDGRFRT